MPRVSIALPVYNGEPFLARTLADLRAQTFADWEAVVCDNASTDGTPTLLREVASRDARVRVVENDRNIGALPNANRAIALGRAPLVSLWGHDDRHHPDFLAALVDALDRAPEATLAYPSLTLVGPDDQPFAWDPGARGFTDAGGRFYDYDRALEGPLPVDPAARFRIALGATCINAPIHGVFRRDVLEATGPMTVHGSDRIVVAYAGLVGPLVHVDRPLFGFRIHPGSTMHMDEAARIRRETGGAASSRSRLTTLARYVGSALRAPVAPRQRLRGAAAAVAHGARQALGRADAYGPVPQEAGEWAWLRAADPEEDEIGARTVSVGG